MTHAAEYCAQQGDPGLEVQDWLKAIETAFFALTFKSSLMGVAPQLRLQSNVA